MLARTVLSFGVAAAVVSGLGVLSFLAIDAAAMGDSFGKSDAAVLAALILIAAPTVALVLGAIGTVVCNIRNAPAAAVRVRRLTIASSLSLIVVTVVYTALLIFTGFGDAH
jgi:hypothetical protein